MAGSVTGLHTFGPDTGPEALSLLDGNYSLLANSLNALSSFSNYYVDSSGAANAITVTVAAPQTFAYVAGIALQVKLANTNTAAAVVINVNALGNKTVVLNDGAVPPIGSLTVGSILYLLYDGTNFQVVGQRATNTITTGLFADGTAGAPSISFSLDPDTGMYRRLANTVSFSAGGTLAADITVASVRSIGTQGYIVDSDGSAGSPAYSWTSDPDTGFYRAGANDFRAVAGGVEIGRFTSTFMSSSLTFFAIDGAVGTPSISFGSDTDTGLYRIGANDLGLSAGGALQLELNASSSVALRSIALHAFADGSAALPSQSYISDFDTGFYHDTANQIAIALGGSTAGQIAQGSFTGTLTGLTTSPTGTCTWRRFGQTIFLTVPLISGTSNANTMTLTGLPAAISPTNQTQEMDVYRATDNAINAFDVAAIIGAGGTTLTFLKAASSVGFTAAGAKGIQRSFFVYDLTAA